MPEIKETQIQLLGWENSLEEEMATHSSILAEKIPWTEEPFRLQSVSHKELDTTEHTHTREVYRLRTERVLSTGPSSFVKLRCPTFPVHECVPQPESSPNPILLEFFFFFWLCQAAFRILVPPSGIKPMSLTVEAQSLNYWTTREVHHWDFYRGFITLGMINY